MEKLPKAKDYYKDKSMPIRYVILGFLLILVIVQLILPSWDQYFSFSDKSMIVQEKIVDYYEVKSKKITLDEKKIYILRNMNPGLLLDRETYYNLVLSPIIIENKKYHTAILLKIQKSN